MKLMLPIIMLLMSAPLFAQPRVDIDNRTGEKVDFSRVQRLVAEAVADAPVDQPHVVVHIWPKNALQAIAGRKTDAFFAGPNHIFMRKVDYLSMVQGVLMVAYPSADETHLARLGRRIWLTEKLVVPVEVVQTAAGSN